MKTSKSLEFVKQCSAGYRAAPSQDGMYVGTPTLFMVSISSALPIDNASHSLIHLVPTPRGGQHIGERNASGSSVARKPYLSFTRYGTS